MEKNGYSKFFKEESFTTGCQILKEKVDEVIANDVDPQSDPFFAVDGDPTTGWFAGTGIPYSELKVRLSESIPISTLLIQTWSPFDVVNKYEIYAKESTTSDLVKVGAKTVPIRGKIFPGDTTTVDIDINPPRNYQYFEVHVDGNTLIIEIKACS
ncbi:hypothetical protein COJ27_26060 [Bacillus cereus]|uniref:hypothetical protein n=1 Tax=Bacillus cereus TaxID=1396 RepID=UPI000BF2B0A7|nr:hypothetical protein [Bacillus cereus]PFL58914.1 hypothetical protein COJ27_26060 [Bacillus cereus]